MPVQNKFIFSTLETDNCLCRGKGYKGKGVFTFTISSISATFKKHHGIIKSIHISVEIL